METDPAGRANVKPSPPPEAVLIRLVREAAGIKLSAAAKAAGVSKAWWSHVEAGYEPRGGGYKEVRARAAVVAHMAAAVGLSPQRLADEGARPDAAEILREILRQEDRQREGPGDLEFIEWFTQRAIAAGRSEEERRAFRAREGWDARFGSPVPNLDDYGFWRRLAAFLSKPALELMRDFGVISDEDFPQPPPDRSPGRHEERRQGRP